MARFVHRRRLAGWPIAVAAVLVGLVVVSPAGSGGFPRFGSGCERADFLSQGATIRAEYCRALAGGGRAVVVLHGCGGFSTFDHRIVSTLPRYGIATFDVDYFALTPPLGKKGFCDSSGRRNGDPFPTWVRIAVDAAASLKQLPGVRRVGIVGWSLGGGVAVYPHGSHNWPRKQGTLGIAHAASFLRRYL